MFKKLMFELRMWLLGLLNGESAEVHDDAFDAAIDRIVKLEKALACCEDEIRDYKTVVREICRRSETSYYDWCCDYCTCNAVCSKRSSWCSNFAPKAFTKSHD